jgi:hypothetical protein
VITERELEFLQELGQVAFLPVARKADDMTPICLDCPGEQVSLALQVLEKKNLISIDYGSPLSGASMDAYQGYPVHGSIGLTARGQTVVEMLEIQGIQ